MYILLGLIKYYLLACLFICACKNFIPLLHENASLLLQVNKAAKFVKLQRV
jgi:hypothetical protein